VTFVLILLLGQLAANAVEQTRSLAIDGLEQINATTVAVAKPCARAWLRRYDDETIGHDYFVPSFRNGHATGMKFFGIRPGGIPYELGFRSGDILESILGFELTSPDNASAMWNQLMQLPSKVEIVLERAGKKQKIIVTIKPGDSKCLAFSETPQVVPLCLPVESQEERVCRCGGSSQLSGHAHSSYRLQGKPQARAVTVAGTFNNWDPAKTPLEKARDGTWHTKLNLTPGRYEYKFVVDGLWVEDPFVRTTVPNPLGSENAVIDVA
jgi:hypothetical protein